MLVSALHLEPREELVGQKGGFSEQWSDSGDRLGDRGPLGWAQRGGSGSPEEEEGMWGRSRPSHTSPPSTV